jgi:hypothetical protein
MDIRTTGHSLSLPSSADGKSRWEEEERGERREERGERERSERLIRSLTSR